MVHNTWFRRTRDANQFSGLSLVDLSVSPTSPDKSEEPLVVFLMVSEQLEQEAGHVTVWAGLCLSPTYGHLWRFCTD